MEINAALLLSYIVPVAVNTVIIEMWTRLLHDYTSVGTAIVIATVASFHGYIISFLLPLIPSFIPMPFYTLTFLIWLVMIKAGYQYIPTSHLLFLSLLCTVTQMYAEIYFIPSLVKYVSLWTKF